MKKICFYSSQEARDFFQDNFGDSVEFLKGEVQDFENFYDFEDVEIITCFTGSRFTKENIDKFPNLKLIATRSTGFDHIDIEYCHQKGIKVSNVPVYGANTVAEFAFAMILAISRKVFYSASKVASDMNFSRRGTEELKGFDLKDKTIGVVGAGNIGKHAISIAKGFGMNVLVFDVNQDKEYEKQMGFDYVDLPTLYAESDIITFHVPYNTHTHHMLNMDNVDDFKRGSILINTSRGAVFETLALKKGLDTGIFAGAGLDVLEHEEFFGKESIENKDITSDIEKILEINKELVKMPNVLVTPHNAFNTKEAIGRIWQTTAENINAFENGGEQNIV